jgi:hypothetical protein
MGGRGMGETWGQSCKGTEVTDSDNYSYLILICSFQPFSIVANRLCIKCFFKLETYTRTQ